MDKLYYDGCRALSLRDLDKRKPEIFMITTNRSGGKTTFFNRYLVKKWLEKKEKFALLYRFNYELDGVEDKFFKDINGLFFPEHTMTSKKMNRGVYHNLFIDGVHCGYAIALNSAEQIKKLSHLFSDVERMLFDEFQSETGRYCADEVNKFQSVHLSIARGKGKFSRYVPVIMLSNPVTLLNPYYMEMGISSILQSDTRFLRGHGWILEQGYIDAAKIAQMQSGFNRAFQGSKMQNYAQEAVYLNDSKAFVEKPDGKGEYEATIKFKGDYYGVVKYYKAGIIYVNDKPDMTFYHKILTTTEDHEINWIMLDRYSEYLKTWRKWFEMGCFRFKNLRCKDALINTLRIK